MKNFKYDECDKQLVEEYNWSTYKYVTTRINGKTKYLHRLILDAKDGEYVDHINGDCLDNRRCNLRICTQSENMMNGRKRENTSSTYKGVSFRKDTKKWQAYIHIDGKKKNLGCFKTENDAGNKYNEVAKVEFGEFARLNEVT